MNATEKERHEEQRFLAQPTTPKSERLRRGWGSMLFGPPNRSTLCLNGRCVRRVRHSGPCWPE